MNYRNASFVLLLLSLLALSSAGFSLDPNSYGESTLRIKQTGLLKVQEPVAYAGIILAIPQNSENQIVQRFSVTPDANERIKDAYGNSMLKLKWFDLRTGTYNYSVETVIKTSQRDFGDLNVSLGQSAVIETDHIKLEDRVRELAWHYRSDVGSLSGVAEVAKLANSMLRYQAGRKLRNTQATLSGISGDGGSYAILLASLLRSVDVPSRIVDGDAWLPEEGVISNHMWVEVLADNQWVPFDAAFIQGGSVSAAYVKKWSGNDLPPERLEFVGGGDAVWIPSTDRVEILDSEPSKQIEISPIDPHVLFPRGLYGWVGATIAPQKCGFLHLKPVSCTDSSGEPLLAFQKPDRTIWACGNATVLWTFQASGANYVCPIRIEESSGSSALADVTINGDVPKKSISIKGLDHTAADGNVTLIADGAVPDRMLFYSPTLNRATGSLVWSERLKPGNYDFYLWFDGSLVTKSVRVEESRTFDIALYSPDSSSVGDYMPANVDVRNVYDRIKTAKIMLTFDNVPQQACWNIDNNKSACGLEASIELAPNETASIAYKVLAERAGTGLLSASVEDGSARFVSKRITVTLPEDEKIRGLWETLSLSLLRTLHIVKSLLIPWFV